MTVMAAVTLGGLFTGCSKEMESVEGNTAQINVMKVYEEAFITRFGQPYEKQTWGFGESVAGTRSGNTSGDYTPWPSTHQYYDANGKLIASANMNHNQWGSTDLQSMPFGGWIVPDPLTEGQKLRVQMYFQANDKLSYQDPHYANFFVQQVYTGGTAAPETGNHETTVGANGQGHQGMTLNQLTVGQAGSHINDFNAGTCTTSQVLNHEGKTQSDQITLMLNVDDTSCFGFHETSGSNVNSNENSNVYNHNDKMALVSAEVIDAWAAQNGNPGEAVVDKWNRSFMGFDYELLPESDIVTNNYVMLSNWDGNLPEYAWDGTNVMAIGSPSTVESGIQYDLAGTFNNSWNGTMTTNNGEITFVSTGGSIQAGYFGNDLVAHWAECTKFVIVFKEATPANLNLQLGGKNLTIAAGTTTYELDITNISANAAQIDVPSGNTIVISRIYIETGAKQDETLYYDSQYLLSGGTDQISFYSTNTNMYGGILKSVSSADMTTTVGGKSCINLKWIKEELCDKGYHPITTDLKTWVKWQAACDGYYSDWIVTLTKAERIDTPPTPPSDPGDFICRVIAEDLTVDQNTDFDFNDVVFDVYSKGVIRIRACGGTLPLRVDGQEVHGLFGKETGEMINTGWNGSIDYENTYRDIEYSGGSIANAAAANGILVEVYKQGRWMPLTAPEGDVASKIAVGNNYEWCSERQDIDSKWHLRDGTKTFSDFVQGMTIGNRWYEMVIEEAAKYQNKKKNP